MEVSRLPSDQADGRYTGLDSISSFSQKEWTQLIHRILVYLSQNDPPVSSGLYKVDRQLLPASFTEARFSAQYCYAFKGTFLPSGNLDGKVWKPSQGAKPTGDGLLKRYFYYKGDSVRIKRQVIWLIDREDWCFLDYRSIVGGSKSKVVLAELQLPEGLQFARLVSLASQVQLPSELSSDKKRQPLPRSSSSQNLRRSISATDDSDSDSDSPTSSPHLSRSNSQYMYSSAPPAPAPAKYTPKVGLTTSAPKLPDPSSYYLLSQPAFSRHQPYTMSDMLPSAGPNPYAASATQPPSAAAAQQQSFYDFSLGDAPPLSASFLSDAPMPMIGDLLDFGDFGDPPAPPPPPMGGPFTDLCDASVFASRYIDDSISGMGPIGSADVLAMDRQVDRLLDAHISSFSAESLALDPYGRSLSSSSSSRSSLPAPSSSTAATVPGFAAASSAGGVLSDAGDKSGQQPKKRKADPAPVAEVSTLTLADPAATASALTAPSALSLPPPSAAGSQMPSFFVAPMEYIIGTVSEHMCRQLIFKRQVFLRTGIDSDTFLEKMKLQRTTVDLREFPGRLMTSFFGWLFENVCKLRADLVPPVYCLVCGKSNGLPHDEQQHAAFFGRMDRSLVQALQTRVRNFYDLVNQLLIFLLRNPQRHQQIRTQVIEALYCPFCSGQNGEHSEHMHQHWLDVMQIDAPHSPDPLSKEPPRPAGSLEYCTKVTMEWVLGQASFSIPPFLLRLQRVQSFLECLVAAWRTLRLV